MNAARLPFRALRTVRTITLQPRALHRLESTYQPPTEPRSGRDRHRDFYKTFGRPLAKNFLIAVATYQVLYFTWLKLESYETKREGEAEVKSVEGQLRGLVGKGDKEG